MNKFINKILREAEDSSDDFFQTKHVNKRNKDFKRREIEVLHELKKGLSKMMITYNNRDWKDEEEKIFLDIFTEFHIDKEIHYSPIYRGYCLLDQFGELAADYNMINNVFWISSRVILEVFKRSSIITEQRQITFIIYEMLNKYFNLDIANVITY